MAQGRAKGCYQISSGILSHNVLSAPSVDTDHSGYMVGACQDYRKDLLYKEEENLKELSQNHLSPRLVHSVSFSNKTGGKLSTASSLFCLSSELCKQVPYEAISPFSSLTFPLLK